MSDISRDDLLALLASIGAPLPENTKIPDESLQKRLSNALDAAQQFHATFEANLNVVPLVPSAYPKWSSNTTILEATKRANYMEALESSLKLGPTGVSTEAKHTFREMRQIVMGFGNAVDGGHKDLCLMDKTREWGVFVRVLQVYKVKETPLFAVAYKELRPASNQQLMDLLDDLVEDTKLVSVQTTSLERLAMLKLFRLNSKRLSSEYRSLQEGQKRGLKLSFVLPLGPISMRDKGKLTSDSGCEICGQTKVSRCLQCLAVSYCGRECQKLDWSNHKSTCRSLKGGTWHTINFEEPTQPTSRIIFNRNDPLGSKEQMLSQTENLGVGSTPQNIHNDKVFLVKIQISFFPVGEAANMMIYDRLKSFQVFWKRGDNPDLFEDAKEMMGDRMKIYRYARRIGDFQLSLCLDRPPAQNPVW